MDDDRQKNRIRQLILKHLYDRRQIARGLVSLRSNITEIKSALRPYGISQSDVVLNLEYLIDNGWVKEELENRSYITPQGREVLSERRTYKLTENGVAHFELCDIAELEDKIDGIDIDKLEGVVIKTGHAIVRKEYIELFDRLDRLEDIVKSDPQISDEDKLTAYSDIQTLKEQLSKRMPDEDIIKEAMSDIDWLKEIPGLAASHAEVKDAAAPFLAK